MKKRVLCVKLVPSVKIASHLHALAFTYEKAVMVLSLSAISFSQNKQSVVSWYVYYTIF